MAIPLANRSRPAVTGDDKPGAGRSRNTPSLAPRICRSRAARRTRARLALSAHCCRTWSPTKCTRMRRPLTFVAPSRTITDNHSRGGTLQHCGAQISFRDRFSLLNWSGQSDGAYWRCASASCRAWIAAPRPVTVPGWSWLAGNALDSTGKERMSGSSVFSFFKPTARSNP